MFDGSLVWELVAVFSQVVLVAALYLWVLFKLRAEIRNEVRSQRALIEREIERLQAELARLRMSFEEMHARLDRIVDEPASQM
jgi:hypothetical protein